jgi:predicted PurR-regulated permease PerM
MAAKKGEGEPEEQVGGTAAVRRRRWRVVTVILAGMGLLVLAGWLRDVTTPLVVALVIAYILDPLVGRLQRLRMRRLFAVILVYVVFLGTVGLVLIMVIPPTVRQVSKVPAWVEAQSKRLMPEVGASFVPSVEAETPGDAEPASDALNAPADTETPAMSQPGPSGEEGRSDITDAITEKLKANADKIAAKILSVFRTMIEHVSAILEKALSALIQVGLVAIYTFFFLLGLQKARDTAVSHMPGRYREEILRILGRLDEAYASFFRGRIVICLCCGLLTSIGLMLCGIPFWLLIGMGVGFLGIIPYIGLLLGLVPSLIMGYFVGGWQTVFYVLLVFGAVECVEPLLTPIVLSRGVHLHPVSILVAMLVGGKLFGLFGVMVSVPLASTVKILGEEFILPPVRELAAEKPPAQRPPADSRESNGADVRDP